MTRNNNKTCECGGSFRLIDQNSGSLTVKCAKCMHCSLLITRPEHRQAILLADFHLKRGDDGFRAINDLAMAKRLVWFLRTDEWPTSAIVVDFGITSSRHFGALQYAVRCGVTAYELDRVMGDGPAITQLVRSIPHQPFGPVVFETAWDDLAHLLSEG